MAALNWLIALAPVLTVALVFVWLDAFKLMSLRELAGVLLLGALAALAAYPLSGRMLDALPLGFSGYSRFVAPWIEEALKGAAVVLLFRLNRIGFKLDAVISGFVVGAGFAVVENALYLTRFADLATGVWMVRGLGTAIMHGATAAILAAWTHEFAERETRGAAGEFDFNLWWFVPGYLAAVALHTLFNQFPDDPLLAMVATLVSAPLVLLAVLRVGTAEARDWLVTEKEAHRAELAALEAGGFPPTPWGARAAALAARSDAPIHDYVTARMRLVLAAESLLLDGGVMTAPQVAALRADTAAMDAAARAIGPAGMAALRPLLPFSRNDLWELDELQQRLRAM